jgi:uncharacterized protein YjbI with pentapeptide repeats
MANPEHLAKLKEGVEAWNKWREENPNVIPDLKEACLKGANLYRAQLEKAELQSAHLEKGDLRRANLQGANLKYAHLEAAFLEDAYLQGTDLSGADLKKADLQAAHLEKAILEAAHLEEAFLVATHLEGANLTRAHLERASLSDSYLKAADLKFAYLNGANCYSAKLDNANLSGAHLEGTILENSSIDSAILEGANLLNTAVRGISYNRKCKFRGIRLDRTHGSPKFIRFAKDQEYLEELRTTWKGKIIYWIWYITTDCGRSVILPLFWALIVIIIFGLIFQYAPFTIPFDWMESITPGWLLVEQGQQLIDVNISDSNLLSESWEWFFQSFNIFTNLGVGGPHPNNIAGVILVFVETLLGYFTLGLLIGVSLQKFARRS